MSYGLPPAYGSTSQPSQNHLPDSDQDTHQDTKPASDLNPNAQPFVPRGPWSNTRTDIRRRRTTGHSEPSVQRSRSDQSTRKKSPEPAERKIREAYIALKNQHFSYAEATFKAVLEEYRVQLSDADEQSSVMGLARSLKEQNREKQKEAFDLLEAFRSKGSLTPLGASTIHNLDLTLSRCEQALGLFSKAEERLIRLRNIDPDADEEILCKKSQNFDADVTNARLWQFMKKHQMTETLLVNVKKGLTRKLRKLLSNRGTATAETLHKHLHIVNIALVRHLQERGLYEWAEKLLLEMIGKRPNDGEAFLCEACGDNEIDLALARLWQLMGKTERAEKLLLNMSGKPPNASEDILCTHSGNREIDLALVRIWQTKGKHEWSEKLLLNVSRKHPDASAEMLCKPFGHYVIDLTLARHWAIMGKHQLAEGLLLNMSGKHLGDRFNRLCRVSGNREIDLSLALVWQVTEKLELSGKMLLNLSGKHPGNSEEILCQPCENYEIDLALVRYWGRVGQYNRAEKLLLNMMGKKPNQNKEILCQPCGDHVLDLALARLWETMGNYEWAERLLLNMSHKHPNDNEERLCKPCGKQEIDLALARNWEMQHKYTLTERLLLNMAGKSLFAGEEALCKPTGNPNIDLTLVKFWELTGDHKRTEKLLLNMSGKHPKATEELLCKPCGRPLIDLALARIWEVTGKHTRSEKLLLNMSDKHPDDTEEDLYRPSGNHDLDLALVRLWQVMNKNERAQRLIHRCCDLYHTSEFELVLLYSYTGEAKFMELITGYQESANTLLSTSVHYFRLAAQQIADNDPESGQDNLKKALEYVESALEKYPPSAGAYSQKAHCLRMMRYPEDEWQKWFRKADTLDPRRGGKFKANDVWRLTEARAVEKVKHQARLT